MKRKFIAALLVGVMAVSLAGCGKDKSKNTDKEPETKELQYYELGGKNYVELPDYSQYVEVGEYMGYEIPVDAPDSVEKQLQAYKDNVLSQNATYGDNITDRVVADTDEINLDFAGTYNGKAFNGGTSTNYKYKIHGGFIESLDSQLVGLECGKEYVLKCKFPDDYKTNKELAGKDVEFTIKVNYIYGEKTIPEWNDSFVAKLTSNKFTTVDDFEKELKTEIQAQNEYSLKKTYSSGLWSKILDSSKINGYPEDKLKSATDDYFSKYQEQYKKYAETYSKTYEEILTAYGFKSEDELKAACEEQAKKELEYIMLACEISKKENIAVTEEIYKALAEDLLSDYNFDSVEAFEKEYGRDYIMESFVFEGVSEWLCDNNKMDVNEKTTSTEAESDSSTADTKSE
ncbi:FKBP-type peptidyl-prolyl cis-trans isomerase [Eshraghiella crossota]